MIFRGGLWHNFIVVITDWYGLAHWLVSTRVYIFGFLKKLFICFNWRIITSQYCDGLCHTSTWISHRHTYVPSLLNLPPTSHPSRLSQSTWFELPASYTKFPLALFYIWLCISMLLSQFVPPSPSPTVSTILFSICVSTAALNIRSSVPSTVLLALRTRPTGSVQPNAYSLPL